MTYHSLTAASHASDDYVNQRAVPERLAALGKPLLVIFGEQDQRWRSSSAAVVPRRGGRPGRTDPRCRTLTHGRGSAPDRGAAPHLRPLRARRSVDRPPLVHCGRCSGDRPRCGVRQESRRAEPGRGSSPIRIEERWLSVPTGTPSGRRRDWRPGSLRVDRLVPGQHRHALGDLPSARLRPFGGLDPADEGEAVGPGELEHRLGRRVGGDRGSQVGRHLGLRRRRIAEAPAPEPMARDGTPRGG